MKNKYFYPIYKLKIKSWIKYWLIKQTEFKGVLSDILEGTSFYLTDCLNMKFKIFDIIGRSVQDGDPTPENPVPIKNTGDNGSVNEKVQNKNLVNNNFSEWTSVSAYSYIPLDLKQGETYTLWATRIGELKTNYYNFGIVKDGTSYSTFVGLRLVVNTDGTTSYKYTFTVDETWTNPKLIGYFDKLETKFNELLQNYNIQLEQGSTATSYVPHEEQNISFPLAQGQKLMQGDYPDDEKVHHKMGEVVFDGSNDEDWKYLSESDNTVRIQIPLDNCKAGSNVMCDYFTKGSIYNSDIEGCTIISGNFYIRINKTLVTTISEFRTWLSSHNMKVQYELAEETTEDFTEEQKTAWEQIKKARTYKNVTHISSEDETPAELKIQYWKEV